MNVRIRLFAILRERAGAATIELELADGATVADALQALQQGGPLAELIARLPVRMAVNRDYATPATVLAAGDELALIPPVSGGSQPGPSSGEPVQAAGPRAGEPVPAAGPRAGEPAQVHVAVTEAPLAIEQLARRVGRPGAGALVVFCGVTREVERLHYEAYREMAEEKISGIARECLRRHGLQAVAIEHRVGEVALGQPSVIVAASAAHREEAFAGAREAIDSIKAQAPIWKREIDFDGASRWVGSGRLTHLDEQGAARMVDVGAKPPTERVARARARLRVSRATALAIRSGDAPKGEVLGTARLAGIQAAKRTGDLIPLAHPIGLTFVDMAAEVDVEQGLVELRSEVRTVGRTGVEMEAMTACAVAALTVYDMVKGLQRGVEVEQIVLLEKTGGRSDWRREERGPAA